MAKLNIVYIRAAIEQATGIRLSLKETILALIQEGMLPNRAEVMKLLPSFEYLYVTQDARKGQVSSGSMLMPVDVLIRERLQDGEKQTPDN